MSTPERIYTLIVRGQRIPVTQAVYKVYYQEYEHERYLKNKSAAHEHSLEQLLDAGVSIDFHCVDDLCPIEDKLIAMEQTQRLYCCLAALTPKEKQIIIGIFFLEMTAKQLAAQLSVSASALGHRKHKILQKLKAQLEDIRP